MQVSLRSTIYLAALIPLCAITAGAQTPPPAAGQPVLRADEEIHRPRPIPDRVVLTWTGDPATTQTVTWRTDAKVTNGTAQIIVAPDGAEDADKPRNPDILNLPATTTAFTSKLWPANYHTTTFRNLKPDTLKSVSGSKMYPIERRPWMKRAAADTQLYHVIRIDGDKLSFEARTATGSLYDAFELVKQAGKTNQLIEKIPAGVPERMKPAPAAPASTQGLDTDT